MQTQNSYLASRIDGQEEEKNTLKAIGRECSRGDQVRGNAKAIERERENEQGNSLYCLMFVIDVFPVSIFQEPGSCEEQHTVFTYIYKLEIHTVLYCALWNRC